MRLGVLLAVMLVLAGCATQRFGRLSPLSETEKQTLTCREIGIEIAKAEEFLFQTRRTRKDTNAAHVLGFLGDFGIGNSMEGNAAEQSGDVRLKELKDLSVRKTC
jgi:hypothetical protein